MTDISSLDKSLDKIIRDLFEPKPLPAILYHYTGWQGAEGILRNQWFWARAHDDTNDCDELISADAVIQETVKELAAGTVGPCKGLFELFLKNYNDTKVSEMMTTYLCCFSEFNDSESQWQQYAGNGRGLCLGLRFSTDSYIEDRDYDSILLKVDYQEKSWRPKIRTAYNCVVAEVNAFRKNCPETPALREDVLMAIHRIAAFTAMSAKTPPWEKEQEWRVVAAPSGEAPIANKTHESDGNKYIEIPIAKPGELAEFDEILIGSALDFEEAKNRLLGILTDAGYSEGAGNLPTIIPSPV